MQCDNYAVTVTFRLKRTHYVIYVINGFRVSEILIEILVGFKFGCHSCSCCKNYTNSVNPKQDQNCNMERGYILNYIGTMAKKEELKPLCNLRGEKLFQSVTVNQLMQVLMRWLVLQHEHQVI